MEVKRINNELYHHGVKGQRWGVRRYQNADGSLTSAGKNRYVKNERKQSLKNRRNLSDEELRSRINRLKLEKEFKRLTEEDLHPGREFVNSTLEQVGRNTLSSTMSGSLLYGINGLITKEWSPEKAAKYIAPEKKKK